MLLILPAFNILVWDFIDSDSYMHEMFFAERDPDAQIGTNTTPTGVRTLQ